MQNHHRVFVDFYRNVACSRYQDLKVYALQLPPMYLIGLFVAVKGLGRFSMIASYKIISWNRRF